MCKLTIILPKEKPSHNFRLVNKKIHTVHRYTDSILRSFSSLITTFAILLLFCFRKNIFILPNTYILSISFSSQLYIHKCYKKCYAINKEFISWWLRLVISTGRNFFFKCKYQLFSKPNIPWFFQISNETLYNENNYYLELFTICCIVARTTWLPVSRKSKRRLYLGEG